MAAIRYLRPADGQWQVAPEVIIDQSLSTAGKISERDLGSQGIFHLKLYQQTHQDMDLILDDSGSLTYGDIGLWREFEALKANLDELSLHQWSLTEGYAKLLLEILGRRLDAPMQFVQPKKMTGYYINMVDTSAMLANLRMPSVIPIVIPERPSLEDSDLLLIPQISREMCPQSQGIAVLVAWSEQHGESQAFSRLRQVYAFDVLVQDRSHLRQLVTVKRPREVFRQALLKAVNLISVSPFVITGPTPKTMFFGHEQELRQITEHALTNNYAVIGGRRIGKTSLLSRLHQIRLPAVGFATVYHDCSGVVPLPDLLASIDTNSPGVLLLDEADKVVQTDWNDGWPLYSELRALTAESNFKVVLCGERTLQKALGDPTSPLFNFANVIVLGPLDYRSVTELVTLPMKQLDIESRK